MTPPTRERVIRVIEIPRVVSRSLVVPTDSG